MASKTQIFCFHRISNEISPAYPPIPVAVFDKICKFIDKRYLVIPLHEIQQSFRSRKPRAVITFDDAYYDFYSEALPVLVKYKLPAVQHVITTCAENGQSFWTQQLNKIIEAYAFQKIPLDFAPLNIHQIQLQTNSIEKTALKIYKWLLPRTDKEKYLAQLSN